MLYSCCTHASLNSSLQLSADIERPPITSSNTVTSPKPPPKLVSVLSRHWSPGFLLPFKSLVNCYFCPSRLSLVNQRPPPALNPRLGLTNVFNTWAVLLILYLCFGFTIVHIFFVLFFNCRVGSCATLDLHQHMHHHNSRRTAIYSFLLL